MFEKICGVLFVIVMAGWAAWLINREKDKDDDDLKEDSTFSH